MNFEEQIELVRAAAGDPKKLALAVLEISLSDQPPEFRRVVEAAAVPRWFDLEILTGMLDEDLRAAATQWFDRLLSLSCIEKFAGRSAWNVHEMTRLALRERLQASAAGRLSEMAGRAMAIFRSELARDRVERVYHHVLANPVECYQALRQLEFDVQARPSDGLALAQALAEYTAHDAWPTLTRAWALIIRAKCLEPYRKLDETINDYRFAESLFRAADHPQGLSWCESLLGLVLLERGLTGDAEQALQHYQRSLEVSERLLAANPESAQAARDVSVSLDRLGDFLARRGLTGDAEQALQHYQRSLEVSERLLAANPGSAQAARDVLVSLERMAKFEGEREDGKTQALEWQVRSLEIALKLRERNPTSYFYQRTAVVSFYLTCQRAQSVGNEALASQCLGGCFALLDELVQAGVELDPPMRQLHAHLIHAHLKSMFTPPPQ